MDARELKISTLKRQRETIEEMLKCADDATCAYCGMIYPEVRKYFEDAGYEVLEVSSEKLLISNDGLPTYLITGANIELSDAEKQKAELEYPGIILDSDLAEFDDWLESQTKSSHNCAGFWYV